MRKRRYDTNPAQKRGEAARGAFALLLTSCSAFDLANSTRQFGGQRTNRSRPHHRTSGGGLRDFPRPIYNHFTDRFFAIPTTPPSNHP